MAIQDIPHAVQINPMSLKTWKIYVFKILATPLQTVGIIKQSAMMLSHIFSFPECF